jgi:hypothetical protein
MSTASKMVVTPHPAEAAGEQGSGGGAVRRRRRRRWILVPVVAAVVVVAALGAVRLFPDSAPAGDSPSYATFGEVAAASDVFVRGEVMTTSSTSVEGTAMTAYTMHIDASTWQVGAEAVVLLPAVKRSSDATAETEPLRVGSSYVLGLVPMGQDWQPTSRSQSVFEVVGGQVQASSDGSVPVSKSVQHDLGI